MGKPKFINVFVHTVRPNGKHTFTPLWAQVGHTDQRATFKLNTIGAHRQRAARRAA